jgi:uncharacterized iron-regulated protein
MMLIPGMAAAWLQACTMPTKPDAGAPGVTAPAPGTIVSARNDAPVSFDEMLADLLSVRIVYVGEKHTAVSHHEAQLRVIRALYERHPRLAVGMEMFDRSYQAVLDRWPAGTLDEDEFLRSTHWYANWRYDYALYRDILEYVKSNHMRLVALNLPFNIPPKIRVGGIEHLSDYEKEFLPQTVDTSNVAHRGFVQYMFEKHDFNGKVRFEDFYRAQCVWEDVMAESIARHLGAGRMVVLAGNGHIQFKYGIPERAFRRNSVPYRTIYLLTVGEELDLSIADYIWITD